MPDVDFIIAGQGLAGSALALTLLQHNKRILVVDDGYKSSSSQVAAGMWNPIVFKKLSKSWRVDELLPVMYNFYSTWQSAWDCKLMYHRKLVRYLVSIDQHNDWLAKSGEEAYSAYLSDEVTDDVQGLRFNFSQGYGIVKNAGFIDVPLFLRHTRAWLEKRSAFIEQDFNYSRLSITGDHIEYNGIRASAVVFCEGYKAESNPWFSYLPFHPAKGETINIHAEGLPKENIATGGVWIIPMGNSTYKAGATFAWDDLSPEPTEWGRKTLQKDLERMITPSYTVSDQAAGIRPATQDRRPFVGSHPQSDRIKIFNGLGTKGVMIAPWLAEHFTAHLLNSQPLDTEVDIQRYKKYYA